MSYTVVIVQDGGTARLECKSYEEALSVKISFENYGRCQEVRIEAAVDSRPAYYDVEGGSMCNGIGRSYF